MNKPVSLPVIDPAEPFQEAYQDVVRELIQYLKGGLGDNLHSLYLFGSVARKTAIPEQSNLDIVVITRRPISDKANSVISTIKWRFKRTYPFITDLSFQFGLAHEVMDLSSIFTWGFMLKHCCVCLYGDDLSTRFGEFEPSWEIAKHWNMDVDEWLTIYRRKIAEARTGEEQVKAQQVIAKKLLRASYSLIMHKDKQWIEDPTACGQQFLCYHPDKEIDIQRLGILLSGRLVAKRSVIGVLDDYGQWLVKAYKKTEFKIG
ncbi:nucleotidyltransferase [Vibrio albus]|uniref:Nucleotidyltransferase n=1 Tax=Vibrio albus TaxID=2200953 RepID=A0A2U3BBA1_9VIBR|nr:nucleotidyltransferase domain-containing protein [Vibrio albus]PWI34068.1 nucleotidyltransferase [Vibrio albus]